MEIKLSAVQLISLLHKKAGKPNMFPNKSLKWTVGDYEAIIKFHDYHSVLVLTHRGAVTDETYMPGAFKSSRVDKDVHPKTAAGKFFVSLLQQPSQETDAIAALDTYYAVKETH